MKTELELRQMFKNFSDCYADTWIDIGIEMKQGAVIQALTEEKFIEVMKQANFISSNSVLSDENCVHPIDQVVRPFARPPYCKKCGAEI